MYIIPKFLNEKEISLRIPLEFTGESTVSLFRVHLTFPFFLALFSFDFPSIEASSSIASATRTFPFRDISIEITRVTRRY